MFVPSLCDFITISWGTGILCLLSFGVFQYLSHGITYMLRAPFFMWLRNISLTHSIDMKKRKGESLRHIAARIPQQGASEIIATISPACKELDILLTSECLLFPQEGFPTFPVPLDNIYGALLTSRNLYILCKNRVFYCFKRETHNHEIYFLDDREIDFYHFHLN